MKLRDAVRIYLLSSDMHPTISSSYTLLLYAFTNSTSYALSIDKERRELESALL